MVKGYDKQKAARYNFTSLNDLNVEGMPQRKPITVDRNAVLKMQFSDRTQVGSIKVHDIGLPGELDTSEPDDDNGPSRDDLGVRAMGNGAWKSRGESVGDPRGDKKTGFRIRKETATSVREKSNKEFMNTQNGFQKLKQEQAQNYQGAMNPLMPDRYKSAVPKEKLPFKEMSITDKIAKQFVLEKEAKSGHKTFYPARADSRDEGLTSNGRLADDSNEVRQNNFMRGPTIQGSAASSSKGFNSSTLLYPDTAQGFYVKDSRKYEKPWLKNTIHEFTSTQSVGNVDMRNGARQASTSPVERPPSGTPLQRIPI